MTGIDVKQLALAVRTIAEEKNLPEDMVHEILEQAIAAAWRRDNGDREQEVRATMDSTSGAVTVYVAKQVVDTVENPALELSVAEAQAIKPDAQEGDVVEEIDRPTSFGRVAAQTAKQVVLQKLREAEREVVLSEFEDRIGTVVTGTVQRVEQRVVRVELGKGTGIMPASEQIPGEYYGIGSRIKVLLKDVERGTRGPQLILSRSSESFIEYLFRQEVPEMSNGAVDIKAIAREAGKRTKLAVHSSVPGVDPVGTFVGGHGIRVQAVMNEIGDQEKIDIITYDENPEVFIRNALSPAEISQITLDEAKKHARVVVARDQLSIAIGRGGQNVRLAGKLTGYELDIEAAEEAATSPVNAVEPASDNKRSRRNIEDSLLSALEQQDGDANSK